MIFFANAQGNITRVIPDSVYQNSHRSSEVVLVAPFPKNVAVGVAFNLPNGMRTSLNFAQPNMGEIDLTDIVDGNGTGYNAWRCLLEQTVTEYAGEVGVQFFIYNGYNVNGNLNLEILATYQSTFNVIKGVSYIPPVIDEDSDVPIYNQIMAYLSMLNANGEGGGNYQPIVSTPPQYTGMLVYLTILPTGQAYIRLPEDIGGGDCDCKPIVSTPPQYTNGIEVPVTIREDNTAYVLIPYSTSGGGSGEGGGESTNNGTAGLTYTASNNVATCTGFGTATETNIVIASEFGDSTVTEIAASAFANTNITSVTIPATITKIGASAFANCASLIAFIVDISNEEYKAIDGNLYSDDGTVLIQYAIGKTDSEFKIPASVTKIGASTFSGATNLTELNCTACTSVPTLGSDALSGTNNLKIIVPYNLYDDWVDEWSAYANNIEREITTNGTAGLSYTESNGVATCTGIGTATATNIEIGSLFNGFPVEAVSDSAFQNNNDITSVTIPNSVETIGESTFYGCSKLTTVSIGSGVSTLYGNSFYNCPRLSTITISNSNENYKAVNNVIYDKAGNLLVYYAMGKTATKFEIPASVTTIGEDAFAYCSGLTEVKIPNSVIYIGEWAFRDCSGLTTLDCTAFTNSIPYLGSYALLNTNTNLEIIVPDGLYDNWINATNWSAYAKEGKIVKASTVYGTEGLAYTVSNGVATCTGIGTATAKNIVIASKYLGYDVRYVDDSAFKENTVITSVAIPDTVTAIGNWAFDYCISLTEVKIGASVTEIGFEAFRYCSSLTSINYMGTIDSWAQINFNGNYSTPLYYAKQLKINGTPITEVKLTTATKVSHFAFENCDSLTSVVIPNSVTSIGSYAFYGCSGLTELNCTAYTSPSSIPTLGSDALSETSSNLKIVVYDDLYAYWVVADGWSALAEEDKIIKETDYTG